MGRAVKQAEGFTLIETIFALAIMAGGLLSLGAIFTSGMLHLNNGNSLMVAKVKAAEAIESVFMSRDTGAISWNQVRNQSAGGIFANAAQSIREAGDDGIVNTSDDGAVETVVMPGADGIVGTPDDVIEPLDGYTRAIEISDINPNLRQVRVVVTYPYGGGSRELVLMTYVSAFA